MSAFKVGDVAIAHGLIFRGKYNGMECVILSPPFWREGVSRNSGLPYAGMHHTVRFADGAEGDIEPRYLRRRDEPPASFAAGEWELCPWRPAKHCAASAGAP